MSESRRLFEEWVERAYPDNYDFTRAFHSPEEYASSGLQLAWEAWQAGRVYEKERQNV